MIVAPIFCCSGILSRTIIGIGIMNKMQSDIIFATEIAMYMTAWSMPSPVPRSSGSQEAQMGWQPNNNRFAIVTV